MVQVLAALLYNLDAPGFAAGRISQSPTKAVCVPGLNCYSCPAAVGACPIGSLQAALGAVDHRLPFYLVGTLLAFGALFGRTVCGWLCPFGLLQELLAKIPVPLLRKGRLTRRASSAKYLVLGVTVILVPLGIALAGRPPLPFFCAWLCPVGTLEAGIPLVLADERLGETLGWQFVWKAALLAAVLVACAFVYRPFCRFLCPLGALYSFFNRFALLRYRVDPVRCTHCDTCVETCRMDVKAVGDRECIQCGACAPHCEQGAIRFTLTDMLKRRDGRSSLPEVRSDDERAMENTGHEQDGRRLAKGGRTAARHCACDACGARPPRRLHSAADGGGGLPREGRP
ncbi:MAG: 4Fe-4S binding protein [Coriobacteriales bacterium]|nr:4Fe-4S binding protein [Coriobacteriales bacterium]